MTPAPFTVRTTARYDRFAKALQRAHPKFFMHHRSALEILATDPYNTSRRHHIKKLEGVPPGQGQWRLSLGRWRFRYDISGHLVELHYCGLRRKETYR
jgi:hypothetical protein